ncbi:MAG: hypothetical protein AB7E70_20950 [Hyphomicrobiaceae bacterium]
MAADAWKMYDIARERMGDGTYDMDGDEFKMALFLSTSDAATLTTANSDYGDLTNEHANNNGYTTGGVSITGTITAANQWLLTSSTIKFDTDDAVWTASGGSIVARFAVIYDDTHASDGLLCMTTLDNSPADVTVTAGNTLTVQINASGVFTITGMT